MDTLVDTSGQAIARRIRFERQARKWSLSALAARSDVSKAAISKIERGEMSPTASVLVRLANAFDLTLAGLLIRAEQSTGPVQRAAEQSLWEDPESGYVRRQLFRAADFPVELVKVYLPASANVLIPATAPSIGSEVVHVLEGQLTLTMDEHVHVLEPGDSCGLIGAAEKHFQNTTKDACTYHVAVART